MPKKRLHPPLGHKRLQTQNPLLKCTPQPAQTPGSSYGSTQTTSPARPARSPSSQPLKTSLDKTPHSYASYRQSSQHSPSAPAPSTPSPNSNPTPTPSP